MSASTDLMLGDIPIPTYEQIVEYLDLRAPNGCPMCGTSKWTLVTAINTDKGRLALGLSSVKLSTGDVVNGGIPVVTGTCNKCSFVRLHNLWDIACWLQDGKPEYKEDE